MGVNISAKFKKDDRPLNGLEAIKKDLIEDPYSEHYIIAKVACRGINKDILDGGTETPTVMLKHIEVMLSDKDETDAKKIFERAAKARLGEVPQQTLFEDHADEGGEDGQESDETGDAPASPEFSG